MSWTLQDDEYLARVRRQYESRYKMGPLFVAVGIILMVGAFWGYDYVQDEVREFLAVVEGAPVTSESAKQAVDLAGFSIGFNLGGVIFGTAAGAGSMLGYGLYLLWGQRKERMLLELSKKRAEQYGKVA